ncbi:MAG: transposase [Pseudomonadota bacterium]
MSEDDSDDSYDDASTESEVDSDSEMDTSSSAIISTTTSSDSVGGYFRGRPPGRGRGARVRGGRIVSSHNAQPSDKKRKRIQSTESRYKWEKTPNTSEQFPFQSDPGLTISMPVDASPTDFAKLFFTDQLRQNLVRETNNYAHKVIDASRPLRRNSAMNRWKDVTLAEMDTFLGIILHMGLVGMPSYRHYWKNDPQFKNEFVRKAMSRNRFLDIMRFWHFGDNDIATDRVSKVRFWTDHLNDTMRSIYVPSKNLSLDESMMLWRGRLIFRQYIKNKRHKYGIKFYELCQYDGIVLRVSIYSGQSYDDPHGLGQSGAIVNHLMSDFFDKGYSLYADNYYNSVPLAKYLTVRQTYICGTLRADRVDNPKEVTKAKLKKGDFVWSRSKDVVVAKWKDKRDVLTISNKHTEPKLVPVTNRRGDEKLKPDSVRDYNLYMSGIDRTDQMLSYHSALRKTIRWYKKVGVHMMEMYIAGA